MRCTLYTQQMVRSRIVMQEPTRILARLTDACRYGFTRTRVPQVAHRCPTKQLYRLLNHSKSKSHTPPAQRFK